MLMSCSYTHVLQFEQYYTNHSVVHIDICKVAIEPCSDHSHHRPPCASECLGTHKCILYVENLLVKVSGYLAFLTEMIFFYFFHVAIIVKF